MGTIIDIILQNHTGIVVHNMAIYVNSACVLLLLWLELVCHYFLLCMLQNKMRWMNDASQTVIG